ncbi:clumping factor B-like isoform X1 [Uranotaenia lowii]|uniref:clumping factor B-like isoform X1 n=1 Tax=Uranotaenia lowii TaxID=190385 RepID=UPI00247A1145|nr:clumping factor B-like isoform X1 [Uranotaenia lowii]
MPITTPKIPEGLPDLMKGLAKSVIRENPDNIYVHAAEYFENLIRERDAGELDKGYPHFSAHKVYADYRDKCRTKGGNESRKIATDGDDDDSGGSASTTRGRRRKRVRKQGSKDSNKSVEKSEPEEQIIAAAIPDSAAVLSDGSERKSGSAKSSVDDLDAINEETPDIEQSVVKVEAYRDNQSPKISKLNSADSETAATAVSTVLLDTALDSDDVDAETANTKDTEEPPNGNEHETEEYPTAPSTAEVLVEVTGEPDFPVEGSAPLEVSDTIAEDEPDVSVEKVEHQPEQTIDSAELNGTPEEDKPETAGTAQNDGEGVDTVDADEECVVVDVQSRFASDENEAETLEMPDVPTDEPGNEEQAEILTNENDNPENAQLGTDVIEIVENTSQDDMNEGNDRAESVQDENSENLQQQTEELNQGASTPAKTSRQNSAPSVLGSTKDFSDKEDSVEIEDNDKDNEETEQNSDKVDEPSNAEVDQSDPNNDDGGNEVKVAAESIETMMDNEEKNEDEPLGDNSEAADIKASDDDQKEDDIAVSDELEKTEQEIVNPEEEPETNSDDGVASPKKSLSKDAGPKSDSEATDVPPKESITSNIEPEQDSKNKEDKNSAETQDTTEPQNELESNADENAAPNENSTEHEKPTSTNEVDLEVNQQSIEESAVEDGNDTEIKQEKQDQNLVLPQEQVDAVETEAPETPKEIEKGESLEEPNSSSACEQAKIEPTDEEQPDSNEVNDEAVSKEGSLEKTESDLNATLEQSDGLSKESSTKESGPDGSMDGPDGELVSETGGIASISSRMDDGDDEGEDENEQELSEGTYGNKTEDKPPSPSAPGLEQENRNNDQTASDSNDVEAKDSEEKKANVDSQDESGNSNESNEEVVEEPCIQRQVSPSTSKLASRNSVEAEEIKKVNLASFHKDSAEALFYSLKQSELENDEESPPGENPDKDETLAKNNTLETDDDADVVLAAEQPNQQSRDHQQTERTFTDDFLEKGPITEEAANGLAEGDGVMDAADVFDPMAAAANRNRQLKDRLHSRDDVEASETASHKHAIRRSMTERKDLTRQDSDYVGLDKYGPNYVQEEDEFDGYYIGNIRNKILASSVSRADSDFYDQENLADNVDENNVRTALETIASTDTESTIASQTTIHANKHFFKRSSQNTSTNIPYASFGNNAIDQSLDEFIEREEQNKEAAEQAASTIQRSYRRFRSNRKLLRDYHSTMRTFTEDQSTESLEEYPTNIIQITMDHKKTEESDNSLEDARMENKRRPMYSLNIDEYDTAARRMTLTRGVAVQRNSTREEDSSGKSDNASSDAKLASDTQTNLAPATDESPLSMSDLSDDKKSSSDEKENIKMGSSKTSNTNGSSESTKPRSINDVKKYASLDAQKLFIARQRTMPVQIDSSLIRVLPKHMRKRNKSAGMVRK